VQVNILYPDQKYGPEKKEVNEGVTKSSSMKDKKKKAETMERKHLNHFMFVI
jgi:hypothetical protein